MKIFKFPAGRIVDQDGINTAKNRHVDKSPTSKSPKGSQQFKKSGSLDLTYYHTRKFKELQKVYRAFSSDKKSRNKSVSSTKSTSELKNNSKFLYNRMQAPKKDLLYPEKKIFLKTEKKARGYFNDLKSCIELLVERLSRCLQAKSQKIFLQQYTEALKICETLDSKENDDHVVNALVINLQKCEDKKNERKIQTLTQKITTIEKQKSGLAIEMKKIKIKQQVQNQEIKKITDKNNELIKQLKRMKQSKQKLISNQFVQTVNAYNPEVSAEPSPKLARLIQQLRSLKEKQNYMNILVDQLQRDGLNLEKIYKMAIRNRQKQVLIDQNASESQAASQNYINYIKQSKQKHHNPGEPKHKQKMRDKDASLADDSIIDDIQALSFNYESKQDEATVYTPKNIYVCQKPISEELKKQLQLNFECLYQEQECSDEQREQDSEGFETI